VSTVDTMSLNTLVTLYLGPLTQEVQLCLLWVYVIIKTHYFKPLYIPPQVLVN